MEKEEYLKENIASKVETPKDLRTIYLELNNEDKYKMKIQFKNIIKGEILMSKRILLYVAMVILIISVVVMPLTGDKTDVRGIGLSVILICTYLIIHERETRNNNS